MTNQKHSDIQANIQKVSRDIIVLSNVNRDIFDKLLCMVKYGEAMSHIKPVNEIIYQIAEYLASVQQKLSNSSALNESLIQLAESIIWTNINEEALKAVNNVEQDLNKALRLASINFNFIASMYYKSDKLLSNILIDTNKPFASDVHDDYFQLRDDIIDLIIKNECYLMPTQQKPSDIESLG